MYNLWNIGRDRGKKKNQSDKQKLYSFLLSLESRKKKKMEVWLSLLQSCPKMRNKNRGKGEKGNVVSEGYGGQKRKKECTDESARQD